MQKLEEKIKKVSVKIQALKEELAKKIVAQTDLIDSLLVGLFGGGHVLVEGVPGLAKTLVVDTLSKTLDLGFNRVQFTPDLLPSDLIGIEVFNSKTLKFEVKKGPIFNNFILADEINRAPSKVQSALLEAMAERHITIGDKTFVLEKPFMVFATQNPIEQLGTYKLPEAELDRFMLKVSVSYLSPEEEKEMYKRILAGSSLVKLDKVLTKKDIFEIQDLVNDVLISDSIFEYVMNLVEATRFPEKYALDLKKYISYGASPRGGLALLKAAQVNALLEGRGFVLPEDVKKMAFKTLGHRIVLSYEAIAIDMTEDKILEEILKGVKVV